MVNRAFLTHSEMELARKVGMDAVQSLMRDKATKKDCEDIIQSINYELDGKLLASNRLMQSVREDMDVVLTMIMQDVHNSQSNDSKGIASGLVQCISCCRPVATPRRRLVLRAVSTVPSKSSFRAPSPNSEPAVAEFDRGGRPPSPPSRFRSRSALSRW